ncbi:MAG: C40 family peptidase [Proteobacteria bacterium]|nr:C40 family peptidase [Pseudomonadota bacterium]
MKTLNRDGIVITARRWIGTPYHHQASLCGVGTDCLGLVRGVWRELYGEDAEAPPSYSRDWAEASRHEAMLEAATRHLVPIPLSSLGAGDVLVFRLRAGLVAKHAAILTSASTMLHAIEGAPVSEVPLTNWWRRRIAGAFQFPGVSPSSSAERGTATSTAGDPA